MEHVTVTAIRNLLTAGRIVEAKALLAAAKSAFEPEELRDCVLEIEKRLAEAATLVAQGEAREREGKTGEAKALYEAVLRCAVDFPSIREHIKRMDEALLLTRAVQRRSERLRQPQRAGKAGASKRSRLLLWAGVGAGLAVAALLLVPVTFRPPLPEKGGETAPAPPSPAPSATRPHAVPAEETPPVHQPPPALTKTPADEPPPQVPTSPKHGQQPSLPPETEPVPAVTPPQDMPVQPSPVPVAIRPLSIPAEKEPPAHQSPPAPVETMADKLYTVRPGDSLSLIAARELCNELAWQQLYQLNRDRIATPNRLLPGMVLRLTGLENRCPPAR